VSRGSFQRGDPHAREAGRLGGEARARQLRALKGETRPYGESFLTFLDAAGCSGPTRAVWRVFWKAADGLPLDPDELVVFGLHTGRQTAPTAPVRECWVPAGRRGGKSEQMVMRSLWRAIGTNWREILSPGEVGLIPIVAPDREQGRNSLSYLRARARTPLVAPYVSRILRDSIEFRTGAVVRIVTASWRTSRGFTMLDALLEECAFYRSEDTANPDEEVLAAIRPSLLSTPGARIYGISSPYAQRGILWKAYEQHWGRDDSDVLVFSADSLSLNPTLNAAAIAREFADDPARAASEYGQGGLVQFRQDVESFIAPEVVRVAIIAERRELPPAVGVSYVAFCDPSGGSQDSMTLAVAHQQGEVVVLDCIREVRPPFSPDQICAEFAELLGRYGIAEVVGDRYGGEWPRERFAAHGVTYTPSELVKSALYTELLPLLNAGRVELLDVPRLAGQLLQLERRVARGGRDSIDHPPHAHDDVANCVAGAVVRVAKEGAGSGLAFIGGRHVNLLTGQTFGDDWETRDP